MKKTGIIIAVISALALVCAGCIDPLQPQEAFDDGMAHLSIGTGGRSGSRALSRDAAQAAYDYYEVIFHQVDDTGASRYYRAAGYKGETLSLSLPPGNYQDNAVVFAGRASDKTLLAVGYIWEINDSEVRLDNPDTFTINGGTSSVQFLLTALTADLKDPATLTGGVSGSGTQTVAYNPAATVDMNTGTALRRTPYFRLNPNTDYDLTYTVDWHREPVGNIGAKVFVHGSYTAERSLSSWGLTAAGILGRPLEPRAGASLTGATLDSLGYHIPLNVKTPVETGWSFLNFSFPVSAFSADTGDTGGDVWYIRGGLDNNRIDTAAQDVNQDTLGGGIVFAVGNPQGAVVTGRPVPNIVIAGYRRPFRVYFTDGTSRDSEADGYILVPANQLIESVEAMGGNTFDDGLGNTGKLYIGRKPGAGTVHLQVSGSGPYTLTHRPAVGGAVPVGSYAEFQLINAPANLGGTYKQEAGLDLLGILDTSVNPPVYTGSPVGAAGWTPVGSSAAPFTGTFDGDGQEIRNLYISASASYAGLFGYVDGAEAKLSSITIASGSIHSTASYAGGIAGLVDNGAVIDGCSNTGTVTGFQEVGGIAGNVSNSATISNSSNAAAVTGTGVIGGIGGIAGKVDNGAVIDGCSNTGTVTGAIEVGGIAGNVINTGSTISNSSNTGAVTSMGAYAGGIAGVVDDAAVIDGCSNTATAAVTGMGAYVGGVAGMNRNQGAINGCSNAGPVIGGAHVGGVAGHSYGTINACYNTGAVTGNAQGDTYVGGILGLNNKYGGTAALVTACYNTGTVTGAGAFVGGVAGLITSGGTITACYNTGAVTGASNVGGVAGVNGGGSVTSCYWLNLNSLNPSSADAAFGIAGIGTATAFGSGVSNWPSGGGDINWGSNSAWGDLGGWNDNDYGRDSTFPKLEWEP